MRSEEVRALGDLAGEAAMGIAAQARDVHAEVADRVFGLLGPSATPVRMLHDLIAAGSYGTARRLTGSIVVGGAVAAGRSRPPDARSIHDESRGRAAVAAINGAWGDRLTEAGSVLAMPLTLRPAADAQAPTPRLAVLVHGLGETEAAWRLGAERHRPYGDRLAAEHGFTTRYVRYNSGRPIADNGALLSQSLDEALAAWPVPVAEIVFIGHSMGALVVRAACHHGRHTAWAARVRAVIMLGAPHTGAPLARAADRAARALARVPETRPFAGPLRARSAGIRDLQRGSAAPFLESADHYFVSASITRDPDAPAGRMLGDLLVHRRSAWAQRTEAERLAFDPGHYRHLGGATHFDLLNHPAIDELISGWVGEPRRALAAPD